MLTKQEKWNKSAEVIGLNFIQNIFEVTVQWQSDHISETRTQTYGGATHTNTNAHTPIIVIYFSAWSVRVQAGCNQRGQTANGSVTFWLSNALWPIWELSPLRIANR